MIPLFVFILLLEVIHHETSLCTKPFVEKTLPQDGGSLAQKELRSAAHARRYPALMSCPASIR